MKLLIFILTVYGFTNIVVDGYIFAEVRDFASKINRELGLLLICPMCFSFWAGAMLCLLGYNVIGTGRLFVDTLFSGWLASGTTWIVYNLVRLIEEE